MDTDADEGRAPEYRQVVIVACAVLGLLLAGIATPPLYDPAPQQGPGGNETDSDSEAGSVVDSPGASSAHHNGTITVGLKGGNVHAKCSIDLDRSLTPGESITVTIEHGREPLADVPVWFNDRYVGATDEDGTVTGTVPYETSLRVTAGVRDREECQRDDKTVAVTDGVALGSSIGLAARDEEDDGNRDNATVALPVDGEVTLNVTGEPYPGERITIEAHIGDVPMRGATVALDGTEIGRTDDDGVATIRVPDDGTRHLDVRVARGDFAGTTTIDVLLLEVDLDSASLAPVPGNDRAVVNAARVGEPVENATVTVGGEVRGTTDADGELGFELPLDPTATVTVETDRQATSIQLYGVYRMTVLFLGATGAITVVGLRWWRRRALGDSTPIGELVARGLDRIVALVAPVAVALERLVLWITLRVHRLATWIVALSDRLARWLYGLRPFPRSISALVALLFAWISERIARSAGAIESHARRALALLAGGVAVLLGGGIGAVRTLPRAIATRLRRLAGWIRALPARAIAGIRGLSRTTRIVTGGSALGTVAAYLVTGDVRLAALAGSPAVLALLHEGVGRVDAVTDDAGETPDASGDETDSGGRSGSTGESTDGPAPLSLRDLWRAFARRVVPGRWRTRTPGEIAREAIRLGYPAGPVLELTALFREVEYGNRPLSDAILDRAGEVYDDLASGERSTAREDPAGRVDERGGDGA